MLAEVAKFTGHSSSIVELKIYIRRLEAEAVELKGQIEALKTEVAQWTVQVERRRLERRRIRQPSAHLPPVLEIVTKIGREFCVLPSEILSVRREIALIEPRHLAMHLSCRLRPDLTVTQIGREFYRDHTTVIHANRKIVQRRQAEPEFDGQMSDLENEILAEYAPAQVTA